MKVNEIFLSIEGEGVRAGMPATFIRLFGCNLRCSYCDTMYSCEVQDGDVPYTEMTIEEILAKCSELDCPNITVTGGEPLIHENITELLLALVEHNYWVNVETNGSIIPPITHPYLFYTMDYKTPSSGMEDKMSMRALNSLHDTDVLKFVVGNTEDLYAGLNVITSLLSRPQIYFSPVFGNIDPQEIVKFLLDNKMYNSKIQLQMHKIIWDSNKRGV